MSSLAAIRDSIYKGSSKDSVKYTKMELERGTPWEEILQKAMLPALNQVGDEFSKGTAFLPELIAAGHAMTDSPGNRGSGASRGRADHQAYGRKHMAHPG